MELPLEKKKEWKKPELVRIDLNKYTLGGPSPLGIDGFVGEDPLTLVGS